MTSFAEALESATDRRVFFLAGVSGVGKTKLGLAPYFSGVNVLVLYLTLARGGFALAEPWCSFEGLLVPLIGKEDTHSLFLGLFRFLVAMFVEAAIGACRFLKTKSHLSDEERGRAMKLTAFFLERLVRESLSSDVVGSVAEWARASKRQRTAVRSLSSALEAAADLTARLDQLEAESGMKVALMFDEATAIRRRLVGVVRRVHRVDPVRSGARSIDHGPPDFLYGLLAVCGSFHRHSVVISGSHFSLLEDGASEWSPVQNTSTAFLLTQSLTTSNLLSVLRHYFRFSSGFFDPTGDVYRRLSALQGRPAFFFTYFLVPLLSSSLAPLSVEEALADRLSIAFDNAVETMCKLIRAFARSGERSELNASSVNILAELLWADRAMNGLVRLDRLGPSPSERGVAMSRGILPIDPFQSTGIFDLSSEPILRAALRLFSNQQLFHRPTFVRAIATSRGVRSELDILERTSWRTNSPIILTSFGVKDALEALGDDSSADSSVGRPLTRRDTRHFGVADIYYDGLVEEGGAAGGGGGR